MDKFMRKRIKQIVENKEKRFGMVPDGHYEKSHIDTKRREQEAIKKRINENNEKIKEVDGLKRK